MNKTQIALLLVIAALIIAGVYFFPRKATEPKEEAPKSSESVTSTNMQIKSPTFSQGESIPKKYSCQGEDISPPLQFEDVPKDAESLALIVDDPDAPGQTFVHWTVWNIDPETKKIDEDSTPSEATEGQNDFGKTSYGGPCPPAGEHRYFFKLYALEKKLDLGSEAGKQDLLKAMEGHKLAEAQLIGVYEKK
jgi:hypothetical protein